MNANALYVLGWLSAIGERGWTCAADGEGSIVLRRGEEAIEYRHKFNNGNPLWFCTKLPERLRDRLPPPFRTAPTTETR